MAKSGCVRLSDVRQAFRLIHDCRDVGHDPRAWPAVMAEGLSRLVDARIVVVCRLPLVRPTGALPLVIMADRGWESPAVRADWYQKHVVGLRFLQYPSFQRFAALSGGLVTRSREQLVADGPWYRSDEFQESNIPYGADDLIASHLRTGDPPVQQGTETGTQLDLTACHGPLDSGGGQTGPRACLTRNPYSEPGRTPGRTDLSRATHRSPAFGRADFVA
jgi:hypothetical protein